jgi:hypothetical protein
MTAELTQKSLELLFGSIHFLVDHISIIKSHPSEDEKSPDMIDRVNQA